MNILFDGQVFSFQNYGGISRYFFEIVQRFLTLKEITPNILIRYSNNRFLKNLPIQDVKSLFPSGHFKGKHELIKFLNRRFVQNNFLRYGKPDIFHPTYYDPYFLKFIGDIPFVVTVYDMVHELYPDQFHPLDYSAKNKRIVTSRASRIIAISENTKKDLIRLYNLPSEKIDVIPLAASLSPELQQRPSAALPEKYILYVGKRNTYKNFFFLLHAVQELSLIDTKQFLVCAGGGNFAPHELREMERLKISKNIIQLEVDDASLAYLYSKAQALVYPSLYEGFGIPILEAFSCGCPAIVSDRSSLPEVGGNAAQYFNPDDITSLVTQLRDVCSRKDLSDDMRKKGFIRAKEYSWDSTAQKTIETYKKIIG